MPAAIVLRLRALGEGAIYGATGRHVHGFWLRSWQRVNPAAGDMMHDVDRRLRPFALSPLLDLPLPRHGRTLVRAGAQARLRVAALDETTRDQLLREWLPRAPERVSIGSIDWRLDGIAAAAADDPDAGWAAFTDLRDRYANRPSRKWTLAFVTPTALSQRSGDVLPFPLPVTLVAGWLDRWRECGGALLPEVDIARLGEKLRISAYDLRTVTARFWSTDAAGKRIEWPEIGCVGTLTLDGRGLPVAERAVMATLVDFAFYCGSGHHTTMGMGQTRVADAG